jgi:hypothetical protein
MEICQDFRELLELLNAQKVEYLIVGAHALAFHGYIRATKDIDLYVRPTAANAERVMAALDAFGFGQVGLEAKDFQEPDQIIQLGYPPVRIDLITSLTGISWDRAAEGRCQGEYGGTPAPFLGRAELVANKKASGRPQDLADADRLEQGNPTDSSP